MTYDLSGPGGFYWGPLPLGLAEAIKACRRRQPEMSVTQLVAELAAAKPRVKAKTG